MGRPLTRFRVPVTGGVQDERHAPVRVQAVVPGPLERQPVRALGHVLRKTDGPAHTGLRTRGGPCDFGRHLEQILSPEALRIHRGERQRPFADPWGPVHEIHLVIRGLHHVDRGGPARVVPGNPGGHRAAVGSRLGQHMKGVSDVGDERGHCRTLHIGRDQLPCRRVACAEAPHL